MIEVFRCFHATPRAQVGGQEVGATRGVLHTLVSLLRQEGVSHVAVALDRAIDLDPAYPPALLNKGLLYERYHRQQEKAAVWYRRYRQAAPDGPRASAVTDWLLARRPADAAPSAGEASNELDSTGGSQAHENMQPFLAMYFIIALQGLYPSRS